jgi:D-lactate dehydrogenase (cytochrome)
VRDADVVRSFLEDAAHVPGGRADSVVFPRDESEVVAAVCAAHRVLPVGAQSSLTGGATPRGGVVLSTRALTRLTVADGCAHVGAGVSILDLQRALAPHGLYYPPVPTYEGAFVGGTIATNAAGAATYKYGSTRAWVRALTVVLAEGLVLDVRRGESAATGRLEIERPDGTVIEVPLPRYRAPAVPKHSGGYFSGDIVDPVDLFVGSEGTLGVIVSATLGVIRRPNVAVALLVSDSDADAIRLTAALRGASDVDLAGIEYIDSNALACLENSTFERAGLPRPGPGAVLLLAQIEGSLDAFSALLEAHPLRDDVVIAPPGDERGAARLFELREAVPATVNRPIGDARRRVDPNIQKTAGDMIVPFDRLDDSLALYRSAFDRRGLQHAIWGHLSDGNLHPNVIPRSLDDVIQGTEALFEIGREVIAMGGSPLAEHGVGRSAVKHALLRQLYGDAGLEEMRAVKRALDPDWKLAPGVLFPE